MEYLNMRWMTRFQQMLVNIFFSFNYLMIIASRGMGKTQVVAACCVAYCILYPGTKIVIAAGVRSQSLNVLKKIIDEFYPNSANLRNEIGEFKTQAQEAYIKFKNGSIIQVVTAKDSARSARANIVICDEFVKIKKNIIDTVLRKFKSAERRPDFFNLPKYSDNPRAKKSNDWVQIDKERNKEVYISSAHYKWHYSWEKFKAFFKSMLKGESYCVCGFPYQLPVSEGYYPLEQVREEMQEDDFDPIAFSIEMESLFFGESANAFFSFKDMNAQRKIIQPLYPKPYYDMLGDSKIKYKEKVNGEIRLLSADIATQGGSKNDATAITLLQIMPSPSGQYYRNILYMETLDGGHGQDQAIRIRQLYDDLDVDYVVVDTNGVGMSIYDQLVQDQVDTTRSVTYEAWSCINDEQMAARSRNPDAPKVIYSIKATAQLNSDNAVSMRDAMRRGRLRMLAGEATGLEWLSGSKMFNQLSVEDQVLFEAPFKQISAFINETVNLDYEIINGKIRVKEQADKRKDRYSSVSYANYIAGVIERRLKRREGEDMFGESLPNCVSAVNF